MKCLEISWLQSLGGDWDNELIVVKGVFSTEQKRGVGDSSNKWKDREI